MGIESFFTDLEWEIQNTKRLIEEADKDSEFFTRYRGIFSGLLIARGCAERELEETGGDTVEHGPAGIKDLIEALQIFAKYNPPYSPTACEHDVLYVMVNPVYVSEADTRRLNELGFHENEDLRNFESFRFGSA